MSQFRNLGLILKKQYVNNILIDEIVQEFDNENKLLSKKEYLYGGFSNYNEDTEKGKETYLYVKEEYSYNTNNNLIQKVTKNYKKNFIEKTLYKYDENNNKIEEGHCFIPKGKKDCKYKPLFGFNYDNKNRLIKKYQLVQFSPHNTDTYYKYDENDNIIEIVGYYIYPDRKNEIGFKFKYEYNEYGNKIKDIEIIGKYRRLGFERYKSEVMKYDEYQNLILKEYLTASGTLIKIIINDCEYDKIGNWIKKETKEGKTRNDLKITSITTRQIDYYKE